MSLVNIITVTKYTFLVKQVIKLSYKIVICCVFQKYC